MNARQKIRLTPKEICALDEIRQKLRAQFGIAGLVLYGSAARGQADEESDVDLLVLTSSPLTRTERHRITDIVFHANLEHGTNFSTLVVDIQTWRRGYVSVLPIHEQVEREGIPV